jgi:cell division protein FtsW
MNIAQSAGRQVMIIALVLVGLGVVMIFSASSVLASAKSLESHFFFGRQLIHAFLGLVLMFTLARVPLEWWAKTARPLFAIGIVLLVLVLAFGQGRGVVNRWLVLTLPGDLGRFAFQPSEFIKLILVLYLADVMVRQEGRMEDFGNGFLPRALCIGGVVGLVLLQPDLGTGIAIGLVALVMLWVGGARTGHLLAVGAAAIPVGLLSLYASPYQWQRLVGFWRDSDPQGAGYQVYQALIALGSGGLFGVGVGNSIQKQLYLPEPHTDFVFAFIGEELGLAGTLSVAGLFVAFAVNGWRIARDAQTYHGFLIAVGITAMISVYAVINIGVATGMLPTTGLPLPFVSYGGSSLLLNLCGVGILAGVARSGAVGVEAKSIQARRSLGAVG